LRGRARVAAFSAADCAPALVMARLRRHPLRRRHPAPAWPGSRRRARAGRRRRAAGWGHRHGGHAASPMRIIRHRNHPHARRGNRGSRRLRRGAGPDCAVPS
jgi:hypothetical protein